MTLAEFLLARIADDEAAATNDGTLSGDQWSALEPERADDVSVDVVGRGRGTVVNALRWEAAHIARHDPARVIAECEAKRRIVELMLDMPTQPHGDCKCRSCWTLRLLALPYADHPDYRQEWTP